jgi:hypothetical protein
MNMFSRPTSTTLLLLALAACTGKDGETGDTPPADTAPTGPGTLALSFQMDDDYIGRMEKAGESPVGTFYGSIYAEDDASSIGPNDGSEPLQDFHAEGLDLTTDGGPSDVACTTEPLEPGIVWVLGCLDVADDGCGDAGDPITIPNQNKVEVLPGAETPFTVFMGMLRP